MRLIIFPGFTHHPSLETGEEAFLKARISKEKRKATFILLYEKKLRIKYNILVSKEQAVGISR